MLMSGDFTRSNTSENKMSVDSKAPEITVRRATLSDRQDVLDLGKGAHLFDGMDYLPAFYTRLLQDKQFRGYIAFVDGDPASFSGFYVDPEEKFFIAMAARTKPCYLGNNLLNRSAYYGMEEMAKEFPQGKYVCLGVSAEKPHVHTNKMWGNPNVQILRRQAYLKYKVSGGTIKKISEHGASDERVKNIKISQLNDNQALQVFQDKTTQKYILRDKYILAYVNCMPFSKSTKYLQQIVTQHVCFASYKSDNTTPRAVSYSSLNTAECGAICSIYIHAFEHPDVVLAHITSHLAHVAKVVEDDVTVGFRIMFPLDIDKEVVKEFLYPVFGRTAISKEHPTEFCFTDEWDMPLSKL